MFVYSVCVCVCVWMLDGVMLVPVDAIGVVYVAMDYIISLVQGTQQR